MDIVIIGAGNVAGFFGPLFQEKGHRVRQVVSRSEGRGRTLAGRLGCSWTDRLTAVADADLYLLAVTDEALTQLNRTWKLKERPAVHTAGAVPLSAIGALSSRTGVFYPLQTIREGFALAPDFPVLIEGTDAEMRRMLAGLGKEIGCRVVEVRSEDRLKMHLAAVFCNNFANHLAALCQDYCAAEALDFSLLTPLLKETFKRMQGDAAAVQTGPARRGDAGSLQKHLALLQAHPAMKDVYELLSASITRYYAGPAHQDNR